MLDQPGVQGLAFFQRHAADLVASVRGDVQRAAAAGVEVHAHQRMAHGRDCILLEVRQRWQAGVDAPAVLVRVHHVQRLDPGLHLWRQRLVGSDHAGEAGATAVGTGRQHFDAVQQRRVSGDVAVGAVGVPEGVDLLEDHAVVGFRQVLTFGRNIGHVVDRGGRNGLVLFREILQRPPQLGKGDLLRFGEVLLAKAQHAVLVQRFLHELDESRADRLCEVEAEHFGPEGGAQRPNRVLLRRRGTLENLRHCFPCASGWWMIGGLLEQCWYTSGCRVFPGSHQARRSLGKTRPKKRDAIRRPLAAGGAFLRSVARQCLRRELHEMLDQAVRRIGRLLGVAGSDRADDLEVQPGGRSEHVAVAQVIKPEPA